MDKGQFGDKAATKAVYDAVCVAGDEIGAAAVYTLAELKYASLQGFVVVFEDGRVMKVMVTPAGPEIERRLPQRS